MHCTVCQFSNPNGTYGDQCPHDRSFLVDARSFRDGQGDPLLGRLIGGEFANVGIIGSGGFGSVYRCIQQPIGRTVAVKILHGHAMRRPEVKRRFIREAKALALLSDPNIVQFIRFSEVKPEDNQLGQNFFFIAQEYIDGHHLGRVIKNESPLPWVRVKFLTRSILKALAAAHKQDITHRDLKPTNIMICQDAFQADVVKVLDFGIAKFLAEQDEDEDHTVTGTLLGTPNYMSPEQIRNQPVGPQSDLYAVGILMYEMLTGERPFQRESKIDTLRAHLEGDIPSLDRLPHAAQKIIAVALCKSPNDRFKSAREMAEALDQYDSLGSFTSDNIVPRNTFVDVKTVVDIDIAEGLSEDSADPSFLPPHSQSEATAVAGNVNPSRRSAPSRLILVITVIVLCITALAVTQFWPSINYKDRNESNLDIHPPSDTPVLAPILPQESRRAPIETYESNNLRDEDKSKALDKTEQSPAPKPNMKPKAIKPQRTVKPKPTRRTRKSSTVSTTKARNAPPAPKIKTTSSKRIEKPIDKTPPPSKGREDPLHIQEL